MYLCKKITHGKNSFDTQYPRFCKKKRLFLQMLRLFDFVQVETNPALIKRFIKNVPKNVPLNGEDIPKELANLR